MKKRNKIFLILIILIILLFIVYLVREKTSVKEIKEVKKIITTKKDKWIIPNGDALKINIYYDKKNNLYEAINEFDSYNYNLSSYKLINSYRCTLDSCQSYKVDNDSKKVIIKDDGYYIYDFIDNKAKKLNISDAYYKEVEILSYNGKIYGLSILNINDKYAFYSYKKEDFTLEFDYDNILSSEKNCLINGNIIVTKDNKYYVINYNSSKVLKESNNYIGSFGSNTVYYYENYGDEEKEESLIYNSAFKKILKNNLYKLYSSSKKGNLIVKDIKKENFIIYNDSGVKIKESKEYKEILDIINENIIVIDNDDYLKIIDIDGNIKAQFMKFNDSLVYDKSSIKIVDSKIYFNIINTNEEENNWKTYYYDTKSMKKGVLNY